MVWWRRCRLWGAQSLTLSTVDNRWTRRTFARWSPVRPGPLAQVPLANELLNFLLKTNFIKSLHTLPWRMSRSAPTSSRWSCAWIWNWRHFTKTGFKLRTGPASSCIAAYPSWKVSNSVLTILCADARKQFPFFNHNVSQLLKDMTVLQTV